MVMVVVVIILATLGMVNPVRLYLPATLANMSRAVKDIWQAPAFDSQTSATGQHIATCVLATADRLRHSDPMLKS